MDFKTLKQWLLRGLPIPVGTLVLLGIVLGYQLDWTGFGSYTTPQGEYHRARTLWDWMELALIPVALALIAYRFNEANRRRESRRAETQRQLEDKRIHDHQEEEALQAYIDRMQELLLEKDLLKASEDSAVSLVAYTLTQVTLKRLSPERKVAVLGFLVTSQLVQQHDGKSHVLSLAGADLEGIGAPLGLAFLDLVGADLQGANLQNVMFDVPNLQDADLRMATFERAHLVKADLRGANLETAVLAGANLWGAICDQETILPNGKSWSGSDLTEFGAVCVPPYSEKELEETRRELHLEAG
ncbi:MAG: pentapeptide repeat-containing protein [Anaerolineaceae bacterium]